MNLLKQAETNIYNIRNNEYPGRGIVIGMSPDGKNLIQIYWIMGRSPNSRNRIFEMDHHFVRTKAFDDTLMTDPSLIIYHPIKSYKNQHIVGNGDQTDTIYEYITKGDSFENALKTREYEPDYPNNTPRISGIININRDAANYSLSILKALNDESLICQRNFYHYSNFLKGFGHCIHTYKENGNPLPSFDGEPFIVKLYDDINENAEHYWNQLDINNKISILVKYIDISSKDTKITIINKNLKI